MNQPLTDEEVQEQLEPFLWIFQAGSKHGLVYLIAAIDDDGNEEPETADDALARATHIGQGPTLGDATRDLVIQKWVRGNDGREPGPGPQSTVGSRQTRAAWKRTEYDAACRNVASLPEDADEERILAAYDDRKNARLAWEQAKAAV